MHTFDCYFDNYGQLYGQSGKTTLTKIIFPEYHYVTLEDYQTREFAINDPKGFIKKYSDGVIIDEAQYVPKLFSYIQVEVDKSKKNGKFILTGSQNFALLKSIKQSLAGRVLIYNLLPLSLNELQNSKYAFKNYEEYIFKGFYPRIYDQNLNPTDWLSSYIKTYVERDIKDIVDINNIHQFQTFIRLCAGRIGQLVNFTSLGNDAGISDKTVKIWLNLLETSYIIYTQYPYYKNFSKCITKSPKLYFYDVGLACNLLGIKKKEELSTHYLKGNLFENFIIIELLKSEYNKGNFPNLYFWRDSSGTEFDCLIEKIDKLIPIEIKASRTFNYSFLKNIDTFKKLAGENNIYDSFIIYGGDEESIRNNTKLLSWKNINSIFNFF